MKNEKKFYEALENIFVGAPTEGEGGYINLLKIKERYYGKVIAKLKDEIEQDPVVTYSFKENFYDMLYNFFEKYFSECGSVYFVKTSNWQRVYEKVYNDNKDVVLFWKTHMLYYVKSDILFKNTYLKINDEKENSNYVFYFDVGSLKQKQNNEKKELVFEYKEVRTGKVADVHDEISGDKTFVLSVCYSERGRKTNFGAIAAATGIKELFIEKAVNNFKKQTTVDFFINKNAKAFLEEQLELFLHQYLLEDTMFDQARLDQIKAVKKYAKELIAFIAQFENELVRIWNKPKFVKNSNYVITIDKLTDSILEKIMNADNLAEQIKEWVKLGFVSEGFVFDKTALTTNSHLPIDTKYFKELEMEILSMFDNLDAALDGRLIRSENYQALITLQNKYHNQIQCTYIDPPFNTGNDFAYIDNYQDSTWLSLMSDRLRISTNLLKNDGSFWLHLDYNANNYGKELLKNMQYQSITEIIFDTNSTKDEEADVFGYKSFGDNFQLKHQTIFYCRNKEYKYNKLWKPNRNITNLNIGWLDLFAEPIVDKPKKIEHYRFFVEKHTDCKKLEKEYINTSGEKLYPIGDIWNDIYSFTQSELRVSESLSFQRSQKPENLLRRIIQSSTNQGDTVLDFFLGSGTTIAVAHKLNRKWLGIEVGDHFNNTYTDEDKEKIGILGRMKIVLNGDATFSLVGEEKNRRPHLTSDINWQGGGFFKYYELEQYEETLDNAVYYQDKGQLYANDVFSQYVFFADEKLLKVLEAKENGEFELDFEKLYKNIDLPETLSLLYGKPIEKITTDEVKLSEIQNPIKYNVGKMTDEEKLAFAKTLKPFLWWGE